MHVTADFSIQGYLELQRLIYDVSEAIRNEVDAERMYILTLGSNQGNAHVHWHVVPLPRGTPYELQHGAAVGWQAGVLEVPEDEMAALAARLRAMRRGATRLLRSGSELRRRGAQAFSNS